MKISWRNIESLLKVKSSKVYLFRVFYILMVLRYFFISFSYGKLHKIVQLCYRRHKYWQITLKKDILENITSFIVMWNVKINSHLGQRTGKGRNVNVKMYLLKWLMLVLVRCLNYLVKNYNVCSIWKLPKTPTILNGSFVTICLWW